MSLALAAGLAIGLTALLVQALALCSVEAAEDQPLPPGLWLVLGGIVAVQLYVSSEVPLTTVLLHVQGVLPMLTCH